MRKATRISSFLLLGGMVGAVGYLLRQLQLVQLGVSLLDDDDNDSCYYC